MLFYISANYSDLNLYLSASYKKTKKLAEEEDDNRDIEGLIDDNPIEEEGDGESAGSDSDGGEKRKHDSEDDDEDLDDEDYALLEENLGTTVKRVMKECLF